MNFQTRFLSLLLMSVGLLIISNACTEILDTELKAVVTGNVYHITGSPPAIAGLEDASISLTVADSIRDISYETTTSSDDPGVFHIGDPANRSTWVEFGTYNLSVRVDSGESETEYYDYTDTIYIDTYTVPDNVDGTTMVLPDIVLHSKTGDSDNYKFVVDWDHSVADIDFVASIGTGEDGVMPFADALRQHYHSDPAYSTSYTGSEGTPIQILASDASGLETDTTQPLMPEILVIRDFIFESNPNTNPNANTSLISLYAYNDKDNPVGTSLGNSGAVVTVYGSEGVVEQWEVGLGVGGNTWYLCTVDQDMLITSCGSSLALDGQALPCGTYIELTSYSGSDFTDNF